MKYLIKSTKQILMFLAYFYLHKIKLIIHLSTEGNQVEIKHTWKISLHLLMEFWKRITNNISKADITLTLSTVQPYSKTYMYL